MNIFGILALITLASVSLIPVAKPTPPTLTTQFMSQQVTFVAWNNTVSINTPSLCPTFNGGQPLTVTIEGKNFTENLSGRDAGSTLVQFRGWQESLNAYLLKTSDLTPLFLTEFACAIESPPTTGGPLSSVIDLLNKVQASMLDSSGTWRVPSSGSYTLIPLEFLVSPTTPLPFTLVANETWTVTTIS